MRDVGNVLVDIKTDMVTESMREERCASAVLENFVGGAVVQTVSVTLS